MCIWSEFGSGLMWILTFLPFFGVYLFDFQMFFDSQSLLEMGTKDLTFVQLNQLIGRKTGGISVYPFTSSIRGNDKACTHMIVRGKAMSGCAEDLFNLVYNSIFLFFFWVFLIKKKMCTAYILWFIYVECRLPTNLSFYIHISTLCSFLLRCSWATHRYYWLFNVQLTVSYFLIIN